MNHRVIARLDIKGPNLVKGIHLEGLRVLGKPEHFARCYYEQGADELFYMDVVASLYNRNSLDDIISRTAAEIFIPLTVGGGLRTLDDIRKVLRAGADKVSLNSAAIRKRELIREAAHYFGSSTIVVTIEAIRQPTGEYLAYIDNGREFTGVEVGAWARTVEELGAGEIVITSVDREGTGLGYDIELTRMVAARAGIPVVACGGAGRPLDVAEVIRDGGADAAACASILHYDTIRRTPHSSGDYAEEGNTVFLAREGSFSKILPSSIPQIKDVLAQNGIGCRR